jgi:hypothetical protein
VRILSDCLAKARARKERMSKYLTWDNLADLYKERTGGRARIMDMDTIFNWAEKQEDIQKSKNGSLYFKVKK